uniref:Uncharacterized protein n=1 Tax=Leptocylindrus danicus TaxID=163516 RepID=A0A7S2LIT6_9STRA
MTTKTLSPHSPPFYPRSVEPIMCDGIPQLTLDTHTTIQNMNDDAIALFPPTEEEISEMQAVDYFTEILAFCEYLEQLEEEMRGFKHFGQRFEARRRAGLPNPKVHSKSFRARAAQNLPPPTLKHDIKINEDTNDLIKYDSRAIKMGHKYDAMQHQKLMNTHKNNRGRFDGKKSARSFRPLHQPTGSRQSYWH